MDIDFKAFINKHKYYFEFIVSLIRANWLKYKYKN